jgi:hypothetical protein
LLLYSYPLDKLPLGLVKFKFYARLYKLTLDHIPSSILNLHISLHQFQHPIRTLPPYLAKLKLFLPETYKYQLPDIPKTAQFHNITKCHRDTQCWCLLVEKYIRGESLFEWKVIFPYISISHCFTASLFHTVSRLPLTLI